MKPQLTTQTRELAFFPPFHLAELQSVSAPRPFRSFEDFIHFTNILILNILIIMTRFRLFVIFPSFSSSRVHAFFGRCRFGIDICWAEKKVRQSNNGVF